VTGDIARRLRSFVRGEVSSAELESRRRAGAHAYSLAEQAEAAGGDDRGTRLFRLCAWNAYALQTIADTLLDVHARDEPGTAGYVRRSTLRYVSGCLDRVPTWLRAARIVENDPTAELGVPAVLPKWTFTEPTTRTELRALRSAYEALEPRIESDLKALAARADADDEAIRSLSRLFAEMTSVADYAQALDDPGSDAAARGEVRWRLLDALDSAFLLGQLVAVPTLTKIVPLDRGSVDAPPTSAPPTWIEIESSWPVRDSVGVIVGHVERACGDRSTGQLQGIDIDRGPGHATLHVPAAQVASITDGEICLTVTREELAHP
jgi:hypothetical protein